MSLRGKVIAITGATSGNALQLARLAASRGAKLALADTHSLALDDLVTEIRSHGIEAVGTVVDVASSQQVDDWINSTVNHFGTLDAAANLAAVEDLNKKNMTASLADVGNEEWNQIMLELAGVMYCVRAQIRVMGAGASIVNALDVRGLTGRTRAAAYSTLQHGVVGLTKSVAKEVGPKGIRVNAVAIGPVETPSPNGMLHHGGADGDGGLHALHSLSSTMPLQRLGQPEEVAHLVAFLLSDESSFMTGVICPCDGGLAA